MQDRVNAHNKVTVHYQTRVEDAFGDSRGLSGLHLLEGPDSAPSDTEGLLGQDEDRE